MERLASQGLEAHFSISHTTRSPRSKETDGVHYHFVTPGEFLDLQKTGAFIESAEYNGRNYGTSWQAVDEPVAEGHCVLLEIEVQGARQIRERRADARLIFLLPPDMEVLAQRLRGRGTDDEDTINQRLAIAYQELEAATLFDYLVVNDELELAVEEVLEIIAAECAGNPEAGEARHGRERALKAWRSRADS
jgi:guanylate kinase